MSAIATHMKKGLRALHSAAPVLLVAALVLVVLPFAAKASLNIQFDSIIENWLTPAFKALRLGLLIAAFVYMLLEIFKAVRGAGGKWLNVGLTLLVMVVIFTPDTFVRFVSTEAADCVAYLMKGTGSCTLTK
jgi:hypothetical protein